MAKNRQENEQRIGKLRLAAAARSSFSTGGGAPRTPPVRVQGLGKHRYHIGGKATEAAAAKMKEHIRYLAGLRKDQIEKGVDKHRHLFDSAGSKITMEKANEIHKNPFIEHRPMLLPKDATVDDLHILSQAAIQRIQANNPQAEVRAIYSIHTDTSHPHSHLLITSQNKLELRKDDYNQLREGSKELLGELYRERGQEITYNKENENEQTTEKNIDQNQAEELGMER